MITDILSGLIDNREIADVRFIIGAERRPMLANKVFLQTCSPL